MHASDAHTRSMGVLPAFRTVTWKRARGNSFFTTEVKYLRNTCFSYLQGWGHVLLFWLLGLLVRDRLLHYHRPACRNRSCRPPPRDRSHCCRQAGSVENTQSHAKGLPYAISVCICALANLSFIAPTRKVMCNWPPEQACHRCWRLRHRLCRQPVAHLWRRQGLRGLNRSGRENKKGNFDSEKGSMIDTWTWWMGENASCGLVYFLDVCFEAKVLTFSLFLGIFILQKSRGVVVAEHQYFKKQVFLPKPILKINTRWNDEADRVCQAQKQNQSQLHAL